MSRIDRHGWRSKAVELRASAAVCATVGLLLILGVPRGAGCEIGAYEVHGHQ